MTDSRKYVGFKREVEALTVAAAVCRYEAGRIRNPKRSKRLYKACGELEDLRRVRQGIIDELRAPVRKAYMREPPETGDGFDYVYADD